MNEENKNLKKNFTKNWTSDLRNTDQAFKPLNHESQLFKHAALRYIYNFLYL